MPEVATELKTYRFDQMAVQVKDKIHPDDADVDRYVGLEHIDPESLKIRRWGEPGDVESTKILFRAGDIIFGKRRAYQRKLAVADFDGICSAHAMVLRPKTDVVLKEFLPFFMQTDTFMERAVKISVGGLSPTINWKDLAKEEFALPPIEEQRRIADACRRFQCQTNSLAELHDQLDNLLRSLVADALTRELGDFRFRVERLPELNARLIPLEDLCSHVVDCLHRTPEYSDSGVIAIRTTDVARGELLLDQAYRVSDQEYRTQTSRLEPRPGDILYSREAPMGNAAVVPQGVKLCISQRMMHLRVGDELAPEFVAEMLNSQFVRDQVDRFAVGSTVLHINVADVKRLLIPRFDKDVQVSLNARCRELRTMILETQVRRARATETQKKFLSSAIGDAS